MGDRRDEANSALGKIEHELAERLALFKKEGKLLVTAELPGVKKEEVKVHIDGDTLVVDTIAIDTRMRNISVGVFGAAGAWTHSDKEHVIERFSKPSKNFLNYQVYVDDPVVLVKPFTSAVERWSLAQAKDDNWTEYLCTANEDHAAYENIDPKFREKYEKGGAGTDANGNPVGR